jgi:hypothetical protein
MFRFTIRDLLWLMVVVGLSCGWWRDHRTLQQVQGWWMDHVQKYHFDNPNHYKQFVEWDRPPR